MSIKAKSLKNSFLFEDKDTNRVVIKLKSSKFIVVEKVGDDTLFLDQDIYYDNDFYDLPLDNKNQIDFFYDMDDYDYIE